MTERELIRELRAVVLESTCTCGGYGYLDGHAFCVQCKLLMMIDAGLAKIAETVKLERQRAWDKHDAVHLKRESNEALRGGDSGKAIKLYNAAFEKERANL